MAKCTGVRCPMQYGYKVEECNHTDCPYRTEPTTNADRIRAMSDEELAKKIPCPYIKDEYDECKFGWHERTQTCEECALEWLRKTASN